VFEPIFDIALPFNRAGAALGVEVTAVPFECLENDLVDVPAVVVPVLYRPAGFECYWCILPYIPLT